MSASGVDYRRSRMPVDGHGHARRDSYTRRTGRSRPVGSQVPSPLEALPAIEWLFLSAVCVIALALMTTAPLLSDVIPYAHDVDFHLARIESIYLGLRDGVFPVRLYAAQGYGMGYPCGVCYPDAFLYVPAIMRMMGMSVGQAYSSFVLLANLATAGIAIASFTKMFGSRATGLACSVIWCMAPYRLFDVLVRASVGEYLAMAFMPMMMCGIWSLRHAEEERWRGGYLMLGVAMAGIAHSHVLSLPISIAFCVPFAAYGLVSRRDTWKRQLLEVAKAAAISLALCAGFLFPFVSYYSSHGLLVKLVVNAPYKRAISLMQLASGFLPFNCLVDKDAPFSEGLPIESGLATLLGVALGCVLSVAPSLVRGWGKGHDAGRGGMAKGTVSRGEMALVTAFCILLMTMTTNAAPWGEYGKDGPVGAIMTAVGTIQFPWRLLAQVSLGAVTLWGLAMSLHDGSGLIRVVSLVAVTLALAEGAFSVGDFSSHVIELEGYNSAEKSHVSNGEYLPDAISKTAFNKGETIQEPEPSSDALSVTMEHETPQSTRLSVSNASQSEESVLLPLLWHNQLEVVGGGSGVSIGDDGGLVRMTVPAGYAGDDVRIDFVEPVAWRVAECVSGLAIVLVSWLACVAIARWVDGEVSGVASHDMGGDTWR